ncbi:MAG: N-acetyltransferase family protein [Coriobacteriales bacterium]|jgi:L-amino acid N-acyltransferase YncA
MTEADDILTSDQAEVHEAAGAGNAPATDAGGNAATRPGRPECVRRSSGVSGRIIRDDVRVRLATPDDAASLVAIYAPYVLNTAITFEYDVPSVDEFSGRIAATLRRFPYLVLTDANSPEPLGYAYIGYFNVRAAYDWCAETSIYLRQDQRKRGLGRYLYESLEDASAAMGILSLKACVGVPPVDDEHLTHNSLAFHEHLGFRQVGTFRQCGYKFGTWYDMVWLEKPLREIPAAPDPVVPFLNLGDEVLAGIGILRA